MKIEVDLGELDDFYKKAYDFFRKCIDLPENRYLQEELDFPLESITTQPNFTRIRFDKNNFTNYVIEVRLDLISNVGEIFGYYSLHEDESGTAIDDFLVFND